MSRENETILYDTQSRSSISDEISKCNFFQMLTYVVRHAEFINSL